MSEEATTTENSPVTGNDEQLRSLKTLTTVIYALQAASLLIGITFLVAVIINYVKRQDVQGTFLESHFTWQIKTFWYGLLWGIIGLITVFIVVGYFILLANTIWVIYRIVKGWLRLTDDKAAYSG
ncbi:MAG: hypothetical protein KZQ75_06435 [Candidatus Thiodiazotropha sp. (ex Myrtea spinifera)]|nr:hypothetical protein [Candidatus Thiodiazotropha sp. (ex Myrtea spinifera)]